MEEWFTPKTNADARANQPMVNNDVKNSNPEGLSNIQEKAANRREKNQEQRVFSKSNEILDIRWFEPSPTSSKGCDNGTVDQVTTAGRSSRSLINTDDGIFGPKKLITTSMYASGATKANTTSMLSTARVELKALEKKPYNAEDCKLSQTTTPRLPTQYYTILKDKDYAVFFQQDEFCQNLKDVLLEKFSVEAQILNSKNDNVEKGVAYTIVLSGTELQEVMKAYDALEILLTMNFQKKVIDKNAGFWVSTPQAANLIQRYINRQHITCYCQASEIFGLQIFYFKSDITILKPLYTTDTSINDIINQKFLSIKIAMPKTLEITLKNKLIQELEKCSSQPYYKDTILLVNQEDNLLLFGLVDTVNNLNAEYTKLQQEWCFGQAKHELTDCQIEILLGLYQDELKRLEEQYEGLQILKNIKSGYFVGLRQAHNVIKEQLHRLAGNCVQKQFNISDTCCGATDADDTKQFMNIGFTHNCIVKTKIEFTNKNYQVPISNLCKGETELVPAAMSIDIRVGDLAEQWVDVVVVCSTSQYLLDDILRKVGTEVKNEVDQALQNGTITSNGYETTGGKLFCQRLLFLPWITNKVDDVTLRRTIQAFFTTAVQHALKTERTSIAFPALGCGALKYDPNIIAEIILDETQKYANYNLKILIVLLPSEEENYRAFCVKLAQLRNKTPIKNSTAFSYRHTSLEQKAQECWKAMQEHFKECILTVDCDDFPLHTWNQATINSFYKYCFERLVLPEIINSSDKLKLSGPKEQVNKAQLEYYQLKSSKADEARIASYAGVAVWLFDIKDGTFEKYSPKLNALIEAAHMKPHESVCFKNEFNEECKIDFKNQLEICGERRRQVIRRDFHVPKNWESQVDNVIRCTLTVDGEEYQTVLERFNETMLGKYTQIRIERIQNQRWHMAYKAYKHFFKHKEGERLLFHGCPESSADMIIHSCFNRSFAGVNGTVYGVGVYFSKLASYSHSYTRISPNTNERCMFLANVLVGKSILGNSEMRTPPSGYDSTTDGEHIFVTYHDDQAYAAYLITYMTSDV